MGPGRVYNSSMHNYSLLLLGFPTSPADSCSIVCRFSGSMPPVYNFLCFINPLRFTQSTSLPFLEKGPTPIGFLMLRMSTLWRDIAPNDYIKSVKKCLSTGGEGKSNSLIICVNQVTFCRIDQSCQPVHVPLVQLEFTRFNPFLDPAVTLRLILSWPVQSGFGWNNWTSIL